MSKRHFISTLIRAQHYIVLIGLLTLIVGSQHVSAQSPLAQDAYAIFEASCLICHGPDGAYRETLLMEHSELIDGGTVVPGNPNASELYKRLLGTTENGVQMPFGQPQLPAQSIDTIRRWILAGAPDWATTLTTDSRFISPDEILETIETHLTTLEPFDRAFARYFTLTHLYNAGETPGILGEYRKALSKLVNSLSWDLEVTNPQPIDPQATIFYINLRDYEWDRNDGWTQIEKVYPYHIPFDAPAQTALLEQLGWLQTQMECVVPSIHVDWFLATASTPPLYHELLSLPLTDRELETRLEVDVIHNLQNAPGDRVWRAGFNNSGVSTNNRVVERHKSRYGAYWKSYDFAGSVGTQNIFTHPLNFTHDGGEVIFNLPNGLQGYYLVDGNGFRLDEAPISIVSNPAASDPTVRNGISCIGCHTEGMKALEDQVRSAIESNPNPPYNKADALRLYVEKSEIDALVGEDMNRYREALKETGGVLGGVEPISRFHEAFQGPVDAAYAAAVVGLETETFLEKVRENTGLQNVGLLALEGENGSVKRDTWTSSFRDVVYALDYPQQVGEPTVVTQPDVIPGTVVQIPDPNLRAAIAEELGKSANVPITVEDMESLTALGANNRNIKDLTGVQFATNLCCLQLNLNQISDITPLARLVNLGELSLSVNFVSDISPLRDLTNLTVLHLYKNLVSDLSPISGVTSLVYLNVTSCDVSDLSPVSGLINLEGIEISGNSITDLSPLAGLIKLRGLHFHQNDVTDIAPLAGLINLTHIYTWGNPFSDLSPLARLTKMEVINFCGANLQGAALAPLVGLTGLKELYLFGNEISDISPIAELTGLNRLGLESNDISDISPLAGLSNLKWLHLHNNKISDISALAGLTNLTWLDVAKNDISDLSPLDGLRENAKFLASYYNPGFPKGGPKIEGPWLWVFLPEAQLDDTDLLSETSGGKVTEVGVATQGATVGNSVGDEVWTSDRLPSMGRDNLDDMLGRGLPDGVMYGTVSLYSPREQDTTMYLGSDQEVRVWLNGRVIYNRQGIFNGGDYTDSFPITLQRGKNVLLIAVSTRDDAPHGGHSNAFVGFEAGAEYTVATGIGYAFSEMPIHIGDTFTFDVRADNVSDLAGWQFDIAFDPAILEAVDVSEGDFLKTDGGATFFQRGHIDNAAGKITGLSAARLTDGGVSGTGSLLQVRYKANSQGETELTLGNFLFGSNTEESIPAGPLEIRITVEERLLIGDVNRDGVVNILDLIRVARQLGKSVPPDSPVDINGDGVVNIFDLTLVAQGIGGAAAPPAHGLESKTIETWIAGARLADDGSIAFRQGIANLENLLASLIIPKETALHANYPNPFNPETWIPYQLAAPAEVALTIYDMNGGAVRHLEVGHQPAGLYQSRIRAAYWDGRNGRGESVVSGLYFYTLRAGEFAATRKMLIRK